MKLLFVLRFVLLFLGLGAMGIVSTAPQAFAAGSAKEEGSSDVEEHHYVRLDTITVTLFDKDSVVGLYTVAATLEIAEADQRSVVQGARSRLRDVMIVELHSLVARRKGIAIPLDAVKYRLRNVAQRVLGKDVVIDLFVENVLRKDTRADALFARLVFTARACNLRGHDGCSRL